MEKPDWKCPVCKKHIGPPTAAGFPMRCEHCEALLVEVKVVGNGVVFRHYRRK